MASYIFGDVAKAFGVAHRKAANSDDEMPYFDPEGRVHGIKAIKNDEQDVDPGEDPDVS